VEELLEVLFLIQNWVGGFVFHAQKKEIRLKMENKKEEVRVGVGVFIKKDGKFLVGRRNGL